MATIFEQRPYTTWSDEEPTKTYSPFRQVGGYALGAAGFGALLWGSQYRMADGEKIATKIYRGAQVVEAVVPPAGFIATFRAPFFLSPLIDHERIREVTGNYFKSSWSPDTISTGPHTGSMLEAFLGTDYHGLSKAYGSGLRFDPHTSGSIRGSVFAGNSTEPIARNVVLFQRGRTRSLNPALYAALSIRDPQLAEDYLKGQEYSIIGDPKKSTLDISTELQTERIKKDFFWHVGAEVDDAGNILNRGRSSEFVPVAFPEWGKGFRTNMPGIANLLDDASVVFGTAHIYATAGVQRLNRLLRTVTEQVPILSDVFKEVPGIKILARDQAAIPMLFSYARRAGSIAALFAISDQLMAEGDKGHVPKALGWSAVSVGAAYLAKASHKTMGKAAIAGAVISVIPNMNKGVPEALGFLATRAALVHSAFSTVFSPVPFIGRGYRNMVDTYLPGASNLTYAAGVGLLGVAGLYAKERFFGNTIGQSKAKASPIVSFPGLIGKGQSILADLNRGHVTSGTKLPGMRGVTRWLEDQIHNISQAKYRAHHYGTANLQIQKNLDTLWAETIKTSTGFWNRAGNQVKAAFAGARPNEILLNNLGEGWWKKAATRALPFQGKVLQFLTIAGTWAIGSGALASKETPQELQELYSGEELVPVRRGAWWEGGGTPYEGGDIMYYRPHWYKRLMSHAKEIGKWGERKGAVNAFLAKNFTYQMEELNYESRPYPISSQAFDETPFLSWLLAPIGKLFKDPKIMHANDWARVNEYGDTELKHVSNPLDIPTAYWLGGIKPGMPVSPYSTGALLGQQNYQLNELRGLVGWGESLFVKGLTGTATPFSQDTWLASSGRIDSSVQNYWDQELGGMFFLSEAVRRFLPKPRNEIGMYNPISNSMPSWIPDELRTGDAFTKVKEGEYRLPGAGYEALHPELTGVDPENYPLLHKYSILSGVAPYSDQFLSVAHQVKYKMKMDEFSDEDLEFIQRVDARQHNKRLKREYDNYIWKINEDTKTMGLIGKTVRGFWMGLNKLVHNLFIGPEKMIPAGFRPIQKLFPYLDPIEEYEDTVIYGTQYAFWDKPWSDWFRPAAYQIAHDWLQWDGIPKYREEQRELDDYFDKLEYYKWKRLEEDAEARGDDRSAKLFSKFSKRTMYGVNPFERESVVRATLPSHEKPFFEAFLSEWEPERRERILELVPNATKKLLEAQWIKRDLANTQKSEEEINEILSYYEGHSGQPSSTKLESKFRAGARDEETYGEWYRNQELETYFESKPLPRPDWIGFCIPSWEQVFINNGFTEAQTVQKGDQCNQSNITNEVLDIYSHEIDEELVQIRIKNDHFHSVTATNNHYVLGWKPTKCIYKSVTGYNQNHNDSCVPRFNKKCSDCICFPNPEASYIAIGELKPNDYLVFRTLDTIKRTPRIFDLSLLSLPNIKFDNNEVWIYFKNKIYANICNRYIEFNEDLCWLLGYYAAEGNVRIRRGAYRGIEFTQNMNEQKFADRVLKIAATLKCSVRTRDVIKKSGKCRSVFIDSPVLAKIFSMLLPGKARTKHIADLSLLNDRYKVLAFLSGLYCGDGSKEDNCSNLMLASYKLTEQAKHLLWSIGIVATFRKTKADSFGVEFFNRTTTSNQLLTSILECTDLVPRLCNRSNSFSFTTDEFIFLQIDSIEKVPYKGTVYDFNIENLHEYHTHIATLHNSPAVDLKDVKLKVVQQNDGDIHEFGLWESQERLLKYKPYISDDMASQANIYDQQAYIPTELNTVEDVGNIEATSRNTLYNPSLNERHHLDIFYDDSRSEEIKQYKRRVGIE